MANIIASSRTWHYKLVDTLSELTGKEFILISCKEDLTLARLDEIRPDFVFFPHWSYIIPEAIHSKYNCVIFHMTDVPFGRGGSPLQNLIARGIYETKISAIKCVKELDAGPVYLKRSLALHGNAEEIYMRGSRVIETMIYDIVMNQPRPCEQEGQVVEFARRKPEESNLASLTELRQVYDYIRMLDADGYPKAFLETEHLVFEFARAALKSDEIIADVKIRRKKG